MHWGTIAAIATPHGAGGIGVVRVSGPEAFAVAGKVFRANSGADISAMRGYTSALGRVYEGDSPIDDAICAVFKAPKSYTGENVAELSCHGGIWVLQRVLRLCLENGARTAEPGEFTKRAFLNGKINLSQAEAVMDIISAKGQGAARAALSARDGNVAKQVESIARGLVSQSALLAAWADFPDEDLEKLDLAALGDALECSVKNIGTLLATYDTARILREGISTAIVGRPNVGKSTLMNLLAGEERSIVTDIPGTTRDVVTDSVSLGGFTLRLADTAGIRDTADPIEKAGVERSLRQMRTAELVLAVFDSACELTAADRELLCELENKPCLAVVNKTDLGQRLELAEITQKIPRVVMVSAKQGAGREDLERAVTELLGLADIDASAAMVQNERQRQCLVKAQNSLNDAITALASNMLDGLGACVDYAIDALLELTGERASDKVVDEVFARFCVGK